MAASRSRIHLLDELRGLCIVLMIAFHTFYTLAAMFHISWANELLTFFTPIEPFFAGIFIALCGFSCRLSKNNWKRGGLLALVAVGISAVLWFCMPSQMIWFGVLHCLAVCILLFAATHRLLDRVPTVLGLVLCALLFVCTWFVPWYQGGFFGVPGFSLTWPTAWEQYAFLMPLGIGRVYSADYFPLLPWLFCFLFGSYLGQYHKKLPKFCRRLHVRPLAFLGRHSLIVYLIHQPIIYGVAYVITYLMSILS